MGSPSIYVWDCNNAGIIVESFKNFAEQVMYTSELILTTLTPDHSTRGSMWSR